MITHKEAEAKFKRCKNKELGYKLAANTRLQKRGHAFAIRLCETDVVIIRPDGTYRLNSGGWRTVTTRKRMNMVLPCCVSQSKGMWFVGDKFYTDRMLIDSDGKVVGKTTDIKEVLKLKTRIDYRCKNFIKLITQKCIGRDIGAWENYRRCPLSRISNKSNLAKLWDDITNATFYWKEWIDDDCNNLFSFIYLMVKQHALAYSLGNPKYTWGVIRNDCIDGVKSYSIPYYIRDFLRHRKPLITEMIIAGELYE